MADVIVDPDVPDHDAHLLRRHGPLLARIRRGWVPPPRSGASPAHKQKLQLGLSAALALLLVITVINSGFDGFGFLLGVVTVIIFMAGILRRDIDPAEDDREATLREVFEQARWYEGRFILLGDLDESSQRLLGRAGRAVQAVLGSRVNDEGLLDDVRNAVMLPAEEWEIARLLAKLSSLRAHHHRTVSSGFTPEVEAVAAPLARALDNSEAAVVARVEALERYATHVAEAERAFHAHRQIEELRGRLPQYEELVAESGADGFAVPELDRLAGDADLLEQALRRSVRSAHEAFRHLDPKDRNSLAPADDDTLHDDALHDGTSRDDTLHDTLHEGTWPGDPRERDTRPGDTWPGG
ncbi:hypothetical protein ACIBKY_09480 [Nonomuraea sp. NPDC050394]|uniref:hypothetical protein n=1 Tax=Nonomuraea sp. NPDC050394 TaxID=3364363 RepID=UPI003790BC18